MNQSFVKKEDNSFVVSTTNGEQIIIETNKNTSNETMNEILSTENDIEFLEEELWSLKCKESDIKIKNNIAKGMYFAFLPVILALTSSIGVLLNGSDITSIISIAGVTTLITTSFNISMTGTFLGRKNKITKLNNEILTTETELEELRQAIDKLKDKTNYKEIEKTGIQKVKPIDRTYEQSQTLPLTKKLKKF